jgi:hypothetical protein
MKTRRYALAALMTALLAVAAIIDLSPAAQAHESGARPITAEDFQQAAPRGFGDRNNSWAQSMVWWHGALYVGTGRAAVCTSLFAIWQFAAGVISREFADTFLPYPPPDPDLSCPPDGGDLSLQAEIWRWTPGVDNPHWGDDSHDRDDGSRDLGRGGRSGSDPRERDRERDQVDTWSRVFQSPLELDNPGRPGKKLPFEMTFRGMAPHTDPDGTEALYAFGVNTAVMWDSTKIPPPRILRTTDGLNFTPIPQNPGTFLGDLPFNSDHSSFRSPVSHAGKLFVLSGPIFGQGSLIGSADPAKGDDAWFLAAPPELVFYEMASFNGWLYLGTFDPVGAGYSVIKTRAEGTPPYEFVTVIPSGAYHPDPRLASRSVVSMHEYHGRLYVGTASFTEIVRINPDDTWDLVIGQPRAVPSSNGGSEWKYPLSGLDVGFGHSMNDHAWQMDDVYGSLFIGTYNGSVGSKNDPVYGPLLQHNMGAHLYRTNDGWYYTAITTNGFADASDPFGGRFDYGIRTMATTPHGAFFGTVNDYYGLAIFRAAPHGSAAPDPPDRLEIEPTRSGDALLSWKVAPGAELYQIWRAERLPIQVRTQLNIEAWNGISGNLVRDTYIGPYEQIGATQDLFYLDTTVQTDKKYMYYVVVVKKGRVSDQSNLVALPLLTPPMTFAGLLHEVDRLNQRGRFRGAVRKVTTVREMIADAQTLAASCQISESLETLNPQKASASVRQPDATDLEIRMAKLERRLELFARMPQEVISSEFCTN